MKTRSSKAEQQARRREFEELAERRFAKIVETRETIPWSEMRKYLKDRLTGKEVWRPVGRKLER
jgi:hypothetical protein